MSDHPTLFAPPPADGDLTERQRFALNLVRRTAGGVTDEEIGAHLHARRGRHISTDVCRWCSDEGRGVLEALRKRGLVTRRRTGVWQAHHDQARDGTDPSSAEFPAGF